MISPLCIALLLATDVALAFRPFVGQIPNGDKVAHPCKNESIWMGVGHITLSGGSDLNPFGNDFLSQGKKWTLGLCQMDSDKDGKSNGVELGDPNCTWKSGSEPEIKVGISHPGICEPVDSEDCKAKNTFLQCKESVIDKCQTIKKNGTQIMDLQFPKTEVPNLETNYYCMTFDLPSDQDYHIKAFDAIQDNLVVLHHILVFGCTPRGKRGPGGTIVYPPASTEPKRCFMRADDEGCTHELIGLWGFGGEGNCFEEDIGFRFGKTSFKRVMVQMHWNNPMLKSGMTDSSGMRIWYQPAGRFVQDMTTFWTGQNLLKIPPRTPDTEFDSVCGGMCTRMLIPRPVHVVRAINHMHYLGKSMSIEIYRQGKMVTALTNETNYQYDNPIAFSPKPHFTMQGGDSIKTTCHFNSMKTDRWTYWGDATQDEMCYGFLIVYPRENVRYSMCIGQGSLTPCDQFTKRPLGDCAWHVFTNFSSPMMMPLMEELNKNCNLDGFCRPECHNISRKILKHPCMNGEAEMPVHNMLTRSRQGLHFLGRVNSCRHVVAPKEGDSCSEKCESKLKEQQDECKPVVQVGQRAAALGGAPAPRQLSAMGTALVLIVQCINFY